MMFSGVKQGLLNTAHHRKVWKEGAADIFVTCVGSVYETLAADWLPVYRVSTPISVLRHTFGSFSCRLYEFSLSCLPLPE